MRGLHRRSGAAQPSAPLGPRDEAVPLPKIRLAIAERMTHSIRIAPHVWTSVEVDLDNVEQVRARHKARLRSEEGDVADRVGVRRTGRL